MFRIVCNLQPSVTSDNDLKLPKCLHYLETCLGTTQVSEDLLPIGTKIWKELETTNRAIKLITEREDLLGNNPVIILL
jgi:hypothetical protein